jgi:NADH-quinone oxidoreductase subunit G
VVALHPDDAAALGLEAGATVSVDGAAPRPLTLDPAVPRGHVAASAGRVIPRGLARRVAVESRA